MSEAISAAFDRIRIEVCYDAAQKACRAIELIGAQAEHIRRSIGQKVRWQKSRIG